MRHLAWFYRGRSAYRGLLTRFLRSALERGEPVLVAVPGERALLLREALGADAGRVAFADASQVCRNPARVIPTVRAFTDRHPGRRVTVVGEYAWPSRGGRELVEAARQEALINVEFAGLAMTLLCAYDASGLPRQVLDDAGLTHPVVGRAGTSRPSATYLGAGTLPPGCTGALPAPPRWAECLVYRSDLRPVRVLVARHAAAAGLAPGRLTDLVLAVSELAANTLRHTTGSGTLWAWRSGHEICCQVRDRGWIRDPLAGCRRPVAGEAGGQGLWLVFQLCDLVEVRSDRSGTTIRVHMWHRG